MYMCCVHVYMSIAPNITGTFENIKGHYMVTVDNKQCLHYYNDMIKPPT